MIKQHKNNQAGFAHWLLLLIILVVVIAVGYVAFRYVQSQNNNASVSGSEQEEQTSVAKIKSMPINIGYYDPATGKAGDILFTKWDFENGGLPSVFMEYGYVSPANSTSGGKEKINPQPTFVAPVGTKVMSIVDGEVVNVPKLYSNDYSVHVQAKGSDLIFETEHVMNVQVKVGDKVKAGQVIAEVSDYDARNLNGMGLVEIGVLKAGNPPTHVCTFDYLDDSIKEDTLNKISALKTAWEQYVGKQVYSVGVIPGCVTREPVEG